jgi:drug/metabolite transporter (DMT)-like permease
VPAQRKQNNVAKKMRQRAYFYLLLNTLCWGAVFPIVKPAFDVTTPYRFLLYRYLWATLITLPILFLYLPKIPHLAAKIGKIVALELLGTTISLAILYIGLQHTTAIEAALLATTTPIFVTLAGIWLLHEKQESHEWLGLWLAFAGTIFLVAFPFLATQQSLASFSFFGNVLIIVENILSAIYFVLAKKYYRDIPKLFVSAVSFIVGLVSFFGLSLAELHFSLPLLWQTFVREQHSWPVVVASVYMGVFGSVIGLTAYIKGQECIETSEASFFWYLQPLVYIPLSVVLVRETISAYQIIGLITIFLGVWVAEKRVR